MKLSIIIPCFNEEESIIPFLQETQKIEQELSDLTFEYLFIDDGSKDNTLAVLKEQKKQQNNVAYLSFSRNFGKESALFAGLEYATGNFITVMDADLQDPPELLPKMYEKIQEGYDVIGTRRVNRTGEPVIRSWFSRLFYRIINKASDVEMVDGARDFRLMTRQVVESILELKEVNRFSKGLFSWVGYKTYYISYENVERKAGQSSWRFFSLVKYAVEGIVNFSDMPLNIAVWTGILSFIASILSIVFVVVRQLIFGNPVTGWASMVSIMLFIGGIQLFALGIIGKYISKIFSETKNRPKYIIREKSN
ncbi:MAG: glycosyltransferase family 2 protein [Streptococcaceae bacterium]|nr:glycosyltransferase family 2 protein [Streptococcaceae bacterium]